MMAQEQEELKTIETDKYHIEIYIFRGDHQIVHIDFKPKGELRGLPLLEIKPILEDIGKWEKLTVIAKDLFKEITV